MSESIFGIHGTALQLRGQRLELLASNIANAATPGYKARDLDFAAALSAQEAGVPADQARNGAVRFRVPVMPSLDGNTVEMGVEQTAFAENATRYAASLELVRGKVDTLNRALRGE